MKTLRPFTILAIMLAAALPLLALTSGTGTVLEAFDSRGYTYVRIDQQGREIWLATRSFEVSAGDEVVYAGGGEMRDFYSASLDRTFDSILFVDSVRLAGDVDEHGGAEQAAHGIDSDPHGMIGGGPPPAPAPGEIPPLEGGKTIAEILDGHEQLAGTEVSLRAMVMKVSTNILGKNWITLQDGTGAAPNDRLVATSSELVAPGDIVSARGIVKTDVSLGSGYNYAVLLEETRFSR